MMKDENESGLSDQVDDLLGELSGHPEAGKLAKKAKKIHVSQKEFAKSLDALQASLDNLRICIKYLMFDLEATRRENKYLRKLLEGDLNGELGDQNNEPN